MGNDNEDANVNSITYQHRQHYICLQCRRFREEINGIDHDDIVYN